MSAPRTLLRAATLMSVILSLTLVSACGSKKKRKKRTKNTPTKAPSDLRPKPGGHVSLFSNEPRYLNPILETRFNRANILIFEGMVGLGTRLEPVPRLATKWTVSADGKTITFTLRKGVTWHDGKPFTSADVKFTYEKIKSTKAQTVWAAYMANIDKVETPDASTVVVTYKTSYAPSLTIWSVGIIPKHIYGDEPLLKHPANREPVGTGPYKLARWELGKSLLLKANPTWWFGRPHIDSIELKTKAPSDTVDALSAGQLDFARVTDINQWSNKAQLAEFRDRFEVSNVPEPRFRCIAWNVQRKLLSNPKVRVALTHALDRGRVIDDVLLGQAQALSAPFFPTMFGADPSIAPYKFDLDRAVKLLDEAGYPSKNGTRFSIDLISLQSQRNASAEAVLAVFRRDLKSIGIELKVTFLPTREFFNRVNFSADGKRDFDGAYFGWLPDIPDPDPYALLHSSQIKKAPIHSGYSNPEVDKLLDQARATTNRDERKTIYHKVHALVHRDEPYTMLYAEHGRYAWNRKLRGVNPADIGPQPRFPGIARWWIDNRRARPGTTAAKPR